MKGTPSWKLGLLLLVGGLAAMLILTPVGAAERVTNPVRIVQGWANGPGAIANTMTDIRTLSLRAGYWSVTAKLFVEGGTYADCQLYGGVVTDVAKTGLYGTSGTITGTLNMSIVVQFTGPGTVRVACTDQGGTMNWWYLRITAIQGGSIRSTPL